MNKAIITGELTICDWCGDKTKGCKPTNDPDEGSHGTLYNVCTSCRENNNSDDYSIFDDEEVSISFKATGQ